MIFRKLRGKFQFLKLDLKNSIVVNGIKMKLPEITEFSNSNKSVSENWMVDLMRSILVKTNKGCFIDVGANVGQTLMKLRSISSDVKYIGFEPNVQCVYYLDKLIHLNGFDDVMVIPSGISDDPGLKELYFINDDVYDSCASLVKDFRPEAQIQKKDIINTVSWENTRSLLDCENLSILKIDVEGGELEVIRSFEKELARSRPVIILEILPVYNIENTSRYNRQEELLRILKKLNYILFRVKKDKANKLFGLEQLEKIGINKNVADSDYLFIPKDKRSKYSDLII